MRLDESQFVGRDVVLEENWLVLRHGREFPNMLTDLAGIHVQALGDQVGISTEVA